MTEISMQSYRKTQTPQLVRIYNNRINYMKENKKPIPKSFLINTSNVNRSNLIKIIMELDKNIPGKQNDNRI